MAGLQLNFFSLQTGNSQYHFYASFVSRTLSKSLFVHEWRPSGENGEKQTFVLERKKKSLQQQQQGSAESTPRRSPVSLRNPMSRLFVSVSARREQQRGHIPEASAAM